MNSAPETIDPIYYTWIILVIAFAVTILFVFILLIQRKNLKVQKNIRLLQEQLINAQKLENIGLMASGISHDIKNILAPISLIVENVKRELEELNPHGKKEVHRRLSEVSDFAKQGQKVLNQIVQHSKANLIGGNEPIPPSFFIDEVFNFVEVTFPKNILVLKSVSKDLHPVAVNPTQMYQVLLNLCINARDALNGNGIIMIRARNCQKGSKRFVHISVADTGPGIPDENREKIFEPHFSSKSENQGSGLGLYIARSIIDSCNGQIELDSSTNPEKAGSTFHIYLPV